MHAHPLCMCTPMHMYSVTVHPNSGDSADRAAMQNLALFSMPIIRFVDRLVGATNAMRVDAWSSKGEHVTLRCAHPDLEQCVGLATAAFGLELLRGRTGTGEGEGEGGSGETIAPGVWYPAELPSSARANIMAAAKEGAFLWEMGSSTSGLKK